MSPRFHAAEQWNIFTHRLDTTFLLSKWPLIPSPIYFPPFFFYLFFLSFKRCPFRNEQSCSKHTHMYIYYSIEILLNRCSKLDGIFSSSHLSKTMVAADRSTLLRNEARRCFGFPRSVAFFNSSKLNSFVRCREPRLLSRGETLHTCLSSPRFELQILLNPATKGRRTTGESLGIALLFEASRLLKCAPSHVFEKFHFGLWIEKRSSNESID